MKKVGPRGLLCLHGPWGRPSPARGPNDGSGPPAAMLCKNCKVRSLRFADCGTRRSISQVGLSARFRRVGNEWLVCECFETKRFSMRGDSSVGDWSFEPARQHATAEAQVDVSVTPALLSFSFPTVRQSSWPLCQQPFPETRCQDVHSAPCCWVTCGRAACRSCEVFHRT